MSRHLSPIGNSYPGIGGCTGPPITCVVVVRRGKGGKPRRQPLPPQLVTELRRLCDERRPARDDPVFCGLAGRRVQEAILARIIARAAERAGLDKRVTAHTLRHTATTWLRQATGDARLVAEYLGHAAVSRYAHVAADELHEAAATLGESAGLGPRLRSATCERAHRARWCVLM